MPTSRRAFLRGTGTLVPVTALAGCLDTVHRIRETHPIRLMISNPTERERAVQVSVTVDGEPTYEHRHTVAGSHYAQDTVAETAGTYRATARMDEYEDSVEWTVTWQDLADCNSNFIEILLESEEVSIAPTRTDIGCTHPLDRF